MANTKKKSKGMSRGTMVAIGATAAALGAGAYYLVGPDGKKHQRKAATLYAKIKKEVGSEIKRAKDVTAPVYNKVVDNVSRAYQDQYETHEKEIKAMAQKLKEEWKQTAAMAVARGAVKKLSGNGKKKTTKRTK